MRRAGHMDSGAGGKVSLQSITKTIDAMLKDLPKPLPTLLTPVQQLRVAACVTALRDKCDATRPDYQRKAKINTRIMRHVRADTIARGPGSTLYDYVNDVDDRNCMASTAEDLRRFKKQLKSLAVQLFA